MGINKSFFEQPIPVPVTYKKFIVNDDNTVTEDKVTLLFMLRRETNEEATQYAIESIMSNGASGPELKVAQFANLLIKEPFGIDDFPRDERELKERAREYFNHKKYEPLIRAIMIFYERATMPLEAYG